ncbi:HNH endonuclease [Mesorhizobium sp.]|uniref:HNH endonuclease n=1 Tax=Mesorhizobium sp. TaxID=1871066 RepID=UPI0025F28F5A|nr:HNH endonuclease [Mesorhizobium sp.]
MAKISPITVARFWSKVTVTPINEQCWQWNGAVNGNGYGNFRIPEYGRGTVPAHRVAYMLCVGSMPADGLVVRHNCDNPLCVNPNHLEAGTQADNMDDMTKRGRRVGRGLAGESNGSAKLTASEVATIRNLISDGSTNVAIGRYFGVHHATISAIRRGVTWAALASPEMEK